MNATLLHGDCLEQLRTLPDNSVDAVVTDPPYWLSFMGKRWDYDVPSVEIWQECLRVLKPGGHLLAFAGTRTQHRMAVRIEDAGFEIRDMIAWVYGSGFPKSLDVSKAIDKQRYDRDEVYLVTAWIRRARDAAGISNRDIDAAFGFAGMAGHWTSGKSQPSVPTLEQVPQLLDVLGITLDEVPDDIRDLLWTLNGRKGQPGPNWAKREVTGHHDNAAPGQTWNANYGLRANLTPKERRDAPATDAAKQWKGWGTALKPALEPITVARKPLSGTVAENVQQHGTGALNVDGCRVGVEPSPTFPRRRNARIFGTGGGQQDVPEQTQGRWPANLIHDGSEEVVGLFPETGASRQAERGALGKSPFSGIDGSGKDQSNGVRGHNDNGGSAARFFYCAKASKADRDGGCEALTEKLAIKFDGGAFESASTTATERKQRNHHPTVKPTDLMRYLCRLVTPPGGVVLDPFMGSGSTGKAAILEGFSFIGCEREAEYVEIARARIAAAEAQRSQELPLGD